jgi:DNA-binding transcriptional regulator YiaG
MRPHCIRPLLGRNLSRLPQYLGGKSKLSDLILTMPATSAQLAALEQAATGLATTTEARNKAVQECRQAAIEAHAAGMTEVDLAAILSVNRLTVRRWLGK